MEALRGVFPDVPEATLRRVLEICDNSVEAASEWILEHDWRDLTVEGGGRGDEGGDTASAWTGTAAVGGALPAGEREGGEEGEASGAARPQTVVVSAGTAAGTFVARERRRDGHGPQRFFARSSMLGSRFYDSGGEHEGDSDEGEEDEDDEDEDEDEEDEEDEDDEDDEDEDDEDANAFFDASDEAFVHGMLPPLSKRIKMSARDEDKPSGAGADGFWVAFDDIIVNKNLIELLNTTLSKLAHNRVVLLNRPSGSIDSTTAATKLRSVLSKKDASTRVPEEAARAGTRNGRISLSLLLNSSSPPAAISPIESKVSTLPSSGAVGQKRKRIEEDDTTQRGFFAHFFPVSDLDMVWRSVMHAHLFNSRFGETIEFHTASSGLFNRRDFDELMHLHSHSATARTSSLSMSPFTSLKCCLILPCTASDEEIFRVGKHLHSLLKLQGSLYYRTLDELGGSEATSSAGTSASSERRNSLSDLLGEDGKMTEDSFRRFAKYRIKREETTANDGRGDTGKQPAEHFLGYQRPRSVDYCLQILKTDGWDRHLSS